MRKMNNRLARYQALVDEYLAIILVPGAAWETNPRRLAIIEECERLYDQMTQAEQVAQQEYQWRLYNRRVYGVG